jgi:hypothetical protein
VLCRDNNFARAVAQGQVQDGAPILQAVAYDLDTLQGMYGMSMQPIPHLTFCTNCICMSSCSCTHMPLLHLLGIWRSESKHSRAILCSAWFGSMSNFKQLFNIDIFLLL